MTSSDSKAFVESKFAQLLDINQSLHRECHSKCADTFIKRTNPGWNKCHHECGIDTARQTAKALGYSSPSPAEIKEFNAANHIYLPCLWQASTEAEKLVCASKYKHALVGIIDHRSETKDDSHGHYYDYGRGGGLEFVRYPLSSKFFDAVASMDKKTGAVKMVSLHTPSLFVADFDHSTFATVMERLKRASDIFGRNDVWALLETSPGRYHAINTSRMINVDSDEAERLTDVLDSDKRFLQLSRKNRGFMHRVTPKYLGAESKSAPQLIGLYSFNNDKLGATRVDPVLAEMLIELLQSLKHFNR
jgi:hypothetical protein